MTKFRIYPYKQGSASAKALAVALNGKVLKHVGSKYRPRAADIVCNWGSAAHPAFAPATTLNSDVSKAQCKLESFEAFKACEVNHPPFWTRKEEIPEEAYPIICRTKLRGHSGDGIVVANNKDELVAAPLYTQYVKKRDEFRVHVMGQEVFFVQRKARKLDVENPNWMIRNLDGGFVFVETGEGDYPDAVAQQALIAIQALNIDFGGVDVIWNEREEKAYVLEVNTACGLEERTAQKYAEAILDYVENL